MRPILPPAAVLAACVNVDGKSITIEAQSKATGLSPRTIYRLAWAPNWDKWRVGAAEKWCAACGLDFWALDQQRIADRVQWSDTSNSRISRALAAISKAVGGPGGRKGVQRLATAIQSVMNG